MSKPDDIPQDVWQSAAAAMSAALVRSYPPPAREIDPLEFIARAILAERERSAKIAEAFFLNHTGSRASAPRIAEAIRGQS